MSETEKLKITKNGVRIYSYKNPALHSFYISLFVMAGCMYEDEKYSGITHFLEHISIRNVNKIYGGELYRSLDIAGLEFNASTYSEMVQFYIAGGKQNFATGAGIISNILSPVQLSAADIDAERKRIKAELRESDEKNSLAGFTNKIVFENTALSASIVGTNKGIDRINGKALEAYRKEVMTKENIFFYVTGCFDDADLDALAKEIEGKTVLTGSARDNIAPVPDSFGKRQGSVHIKNSDFAIARFTFDLDMTRYSMAETDLLYDILLSGYNSRLFVEMSEIRGLFYDISGAVERYKNIGTLYFSFELKEKDLPEAVSIVVDILNSIKNGELDSECMKAGYVDNAYMLYDDSRELNFTFAYDNHVMNENYVSVEERRERYRNITSERLARIAREVFVPENLTVTVKAKANKIDKKKIEDILRRLK